MSAIKAAAADVGDFEMVDTQIHSQNFPTHKVREYGYFFLKWKEGLTELHDSISVEIHNQFICIWMHRVEKEKQGKDKKELLQLRIEAIRLQFEPYRIDIAKEEKDDSLYLDEIRKGIAQVLHHWREVYCMGWTDIVDIKREFKQWTQTEAGGNMAKTAADKYVSYLNSFETKHPEDGYVIWYAWTPSSLNKIRKQLENDQVWNRWQQNHPKEANNANAALNKYATFLEYFSPLISHKKTEQFSAITDSMKNDILTSVNTILYGPPGTGKTYNTRRYALATCFKNADVEEKNKIRAMLSSEDDKSIKNEYDDLVKAGRIRFVTFHQSYGYEEFIQGISAKTENGKVEYFVKKGVFVDFCETARGKEEPYIFIIDEINRGNISKIFGELITLIEDTKREGCDDAQFAELPHGGRFSVPKNVYILGTMNTADRSIALLDTALRRRFDFIEMMPSQTLLDGVTVDGINIQKLLNCMNERIEFLFDREHTIGHAFFMSLRKNPTAEKLKEIFRNKVIPLLQEYFYDDYQKIGLVLGSSFVKKAKAPDSLQKQNLGDVYRIAGKDEWNFRAILTATDSEKSEESESE